MSDIDLIKIYEWDRLSEEGRDLITSPYTANRRAVLQEMMDIEIHEGEIMRVMEPEGAVEALAILETDIATEEVHILHPEIGVVEVPGQIATNKRIVRNYLRDQIGALRNILEIRQLDPRNLDRDFSEIQLEIDIEGLSRAEIIYKFIEHHHKHFAWASNRHGLELVNQDMSVEVTSPHLDHPRFRDLPGGQDFVSAIDEQIKGDPEQAIVIHKHIIRKGDKTKLLMPLVDYGFDGSWVGNGDDPQLTLDEGQYRQAFEAMEHMMRSNEQVTGLFSEGTWTLHPANFEPRDEWQGKSFARFEFLHNGMNPDQYRYEIGVAEPDPEHPLQDQYQFAIKSPHRRGIMDRGEFEIVVCGQFWPREDFLREDASWRG